MEQAMAGRQTTIRIWRGDAAGGAFRDYAIALEPGMVVLDAVRALQAGEAPDLAARWNCKAGRCGSCSAEIDGQPRLMCMTRIDTAERSVSVAPLRTFPVIKDLVTDVSFNYEKMADAGTFLPLEAGGESPVMYQEDVDRVRELHNCIECFLCQNVCHVVRDHEDNKARFSGPRTFVRLAALDMHPLDQGDRVQAAQDAGVRHCNVTRCCTEVCPEGIRITDNAIIPLKEKLADRYYDPLARTLRWFSNATRRRP